MDDGAPLFDKERCHVQTARFGAPALRCLPSTGYFRRNDCCRSLSCCSQRWSWSCSA